MVIVAFKASLFFLGYSDYLLYPFYITYGVLAMAGFFTTKPKEWVVSLAVCLYFYINLVSLFDHSSLYSRVFYMMDKNPKKQLYKVINKKRPKSSPNRLNTPNLAAKQLFIVI